MSSEFYTPRNEQSSFLALSYPKHRMELASRDCVQSMPNSFDIPETQVEVLERIEELVGEVGPKCFNKQKHIELMALLKQVKDVMSDELQKAREDYTKAFVLDKEELLEWHKDIEINKKGPEKVESFKSFFENNLNDNKIAWFYYLYVEFVVNCYQNECKDESGEIVYSLDKAMLIFDDALRDTGYDFQNSHMIWDKFYKFSKQVIVGSDYSQLKNHILERLRIPHKELAETFALFSAFVTAYYNDCYEVVMIDATKIFTETQKQIWNLELEEWEDRTSSYEDDAEHWIKYMDLFATRPKKQRKLEPITALFERSIHAGQQDFMFTKVWVKYINILYEFQAPEATIFSILQRFMRKYPDYDTPLIEVFQNIPNMQFPDEAEDMFSIAVSRAELFIRSQEGYFKELISSLISCEYKMSIKGSESFIDSLLDHINIFFNDALKNCKDAYHVVERLSVSIIEELGEYKTVRDYLNKLTSTFETQAEIWLLSHEFEKRQGDYKTASKILYAAITRSDKLDWPERIFEEAMTYERVHGSVDSYRQLKVRIDKKSKELNDRRREAEIFADIEALEKEEEKPEKRKAEEEQKKDEDASLKKRKIEQSRDREHLTLSILNIPLGTTEIQLSKFFKDCGEIRDLHLVEKDSQLNAKVEFLDEKGVTRALTKDHKKIRGSELRVFKAFKTTVWVTNFPPSYTSDIVEELFKRVGPVASVRFPSLKFNAQRRFCYVEFLDSKDATKSVSEFNDREIEGYKLVVKISDPESKTARTGAVEECRELYVSKLDFYKVTMDKVKQLFEKYGSVERVNLPLNEHNKKQGKKHDGYGFVTFSTPEEAQAALELNLIALEGRAIEVSISKKKSERVQKMANKAFKDYLFADNVISLLKVPDTINAVQIKEFCSEAGEIKHVILEPEHEGAIVEFEDQREAAQAALKLNGKLTGNYTVQIGTVRELRKANNIPKPAVFARTMVPSSLRRRQAFKKTSSVSDPAAMPSTATTEEKSSSMTGRTNADFRAMLLGKK